MKSAIRLFTVLFLLGVACCARADPDLESTQKKKPARLSVNLVKQKDGSVIERLDLSALPGSARDDAIPASPNEWLARMVDPTRNGLVIKRPQLLAEWLDAVTEPRFMTALATMAMDPSTFPRTVNRLADPATARNWSEFVDPEIFARWIAAGMDPHLYQAVFQHMFDPKKYLRWATYYGAPQAGSLPTAESEKALQAAATASVRSSHASNQDWMQLPGREPRSNPWLAGSNSYRY